DRLSRSMLDLPNVMNQATREGWALVALDVAVDTSTPSGEAMANMLATFRCVRAATDRSAHGLRREASGGTRQLFATSCSARRSRRAAGIVAPPLPREAAPLDRLGLRAGRSTNHAHLFRSGRRMSFHGKWRPSRWRSRFPPIWQPEATMYCGV